MFDRLMFSVVSLDPWGLWLLEVGGPGHWIDQTPYSTGTEQKNIVRTVTKNCRDTSVTWQVVWVAHERYGDEQTECGGDGVRQPPGSDPARVTPVNTYSSPANTPAIHKLDQPIKDQLHTDY